MQSSIVRTQISVFESWGCILTASKDKYIFTSAMQQLQERLTISHPNYLSGRQNWRKRQQELNQSLNQAKVTKDSNNPALTDLNLQLMSLGIYETPPQIVVHVELPQVLPADVSPQEMDSTDTLRLQVALSDIVSPTLGKMNFELRANAPRIISDTIEQTIGAGMVDGAKGVMAGIFLLPDAKDQSIAAKTGFVIPLRFVTEINLDRKGRKEVSRASRVDEVPEERLRRVAFLSVPQSSNR